MNKSKEEILDKEGFDFDAFEYENEFSAKAILKAMSEYAQQEAIAFAEWMRDNHYIHNSLINKDGKFWFRQYTSPDKRELHTTEQLYQIYKSHP